MTVTIGYISISYMLTTALIYSADTKTLIADTKELNIRSLYRGIKKIQCQYKCTIYNRYKCIRYSDAFPQNCLRKQPKFIRRELLNISVQVYLPAHLTGQYVFPCPVLKTLLISCLFPRK